MVNLLSLGATRGKVSTSPACFMAEKDNYPKAKLLLQWRNSLPLQNQEMAQVALFLMRENVSLLSLISSTQTVYSGTETLWEKSRKLHTEEELQHTHHNKNGNDKLIV